MRHPHQAIHHRQLSVWQRALDLALEIRAMCEPLTQRDFVLIGEPMWQGAMEMMTEIALMSSATDDAVRRRHIERARRALCRLHARYDVARQLRLIDQDDEFARQLDRQRTELERFAAAQM